MVVVVGIDSFEDHGQKGGPAPHIVLFALILNKQTTTKRSVGPQSGEVEK
ncbi:hypothetical protein CJ030_MR8G002041 [Morella rubra]|uniref:Uncharacterized protein n=1 Tax=Morella rubra TaxID=262757 RepID=A0A6A1UR62_9ROSI|nr:hypothetical protein CJ030_MR8G002041 [Morella rubra]